MKPLLTALSFSGGRQSTWLLEAILRNEFTIPDRFAVVTADPGMEKQSTYALIDQMEQRCQTAGIRFVRAPGPNLYHDLMNLGNKTRMENPPFWTSDDGKCGKLQHKCTREYKIRPIRRACRRLLEEMWGIPATAAGNHMLRPGAVVNWICFAANETRRVKDSDSTWAVPGYPLIDAGVTDDDIAADYRRWGITPPEPSLCNGCPFHGLRMRRQQFQNHADWKQAVDVDNAVRNLSQIGVNNPCYTSDTLIPLETLAQNNFSTGDETKDEMATCSSGVCFI